MAQIDRFYGIKFPFTVDNTNGRFVDLNETLDDKVASSILHVMLTKKRTRLRNPDFGTDLISFIFEQNTESTWDKVKKSVIEDVSKYVNNARINDIRIYQTEDDENAVILVIYYDIIAGNTVINKRLGIKL